ncbi:MAG TPA: acetoin utilization protein AcuC [Mycobacteriales bacterium]|nr:acetoin utilization protein AcuC [Mycobacteriales bacterium]
MICSVTAAWDERLLGYDFGDGHPLNPVRVELTMALARSLGVLDRMTVIGFEPAADDLLGLVHARSYIDAVRSASQTLRPNPAHGLGTPDDPVFPGMHEASAMVVGATVAAARAVVSGASDHGVSISGGLHHAMTSSASGFCIYNDPAVAIAWLLEQGFERIAYVDIDVHHGDGVQAIFWDDPRVLTISLHESGRTLFPGTGFADEIGGPHARGTALNIAFAPAVRDRWWHEEFDAAVPAALRDFQPEFLVSQHGCDTHRLDPLANLELTVDGQLAAHEKLHELAHEFCDGRWLATGGGGYELVQVVPRSWTHLLAVATGEPIEPATPTPEEWREFVRSRTGRTAPILMTDLTPEGAFE